MSDDNSYVADPARLQRGIREIDSIRGFAKNMLNAFVDGVSLTKDWPGEDDSFAKEVRPRETKEREGSTETVQSISDAVVGIADGTTKNLHNITGTQSDNLEAIHNSRPGRGPHGKH